MIILSAISQQQQNSFRDHFSRAKEQLNHVCKMSVTD